MKRLRQLNNFRHNLNHDSSSPSSPRNSHVSKQFGCPEKQAIVVLACAVVCVTFFVHVRCLGFTFAWRLNPRQTHEFQEFLAVIQHVIFHACRRLSVCAHFFCVALCCCFLIAGLLLQLLLVCVAQLQRLSKLGIRRRKHKLVLCPFRLGCLCGRRDRLGGW